ncbi:MAG: class I SAM-dependent methyltransferase [Leptonema sp. (in: bacteria)]
MIQNLKVFFTKLKSGTEYLNYGREIILEWAIDYIIKNYKIKNQKSFTILDQGCGHGDDLINISSEVKKRNLPVKVQLIGIENYELYVNECKQKGIKVYSLDIEKDWYPFKDQSIDIIISNQVLEHTKEIFWIVEQFTRIHKPDGILIVGVPNLASLHNRILLLFGQQPTAQQSLGPHVRTFTLPDLKVFLETNQFYKFLDRKGSNFYPFPPTISRVLAKMFPSLAWGLFAKFQRTEKKGRFIDYLQENLLETPFYGSPQNPAKYYVPARNHRKK